MNIAETVVKIAENDPNNKGKFFRWKKNNDTYEITAFHRTHSGKVEECSWNKKFILDYLTDKKYDTDEFGFDTIRFAKQSAVIQDIKKKIINTKYRNLYVYTLGKYIKIKFKHPLDRSEYHSIFSVDGGKSFWFLYNGRNVGRVKFRTYMDMIGQLKDIDKNVKTRIDHS